MKKIVKNVLKVIAVSSTICGLSVVQQEVTIAYAQITNQSFSVEAILLQSNMTETQQAFVRHIYPYVKQVNEKYGVLPSVTLAQAILESNWGRSDLGAAPHFNLFGIKASADWNGNVYKKETREYVNGQQIVVEQPFRSYSSYEESILDYGKFFTSTSWRMKNYETFLNSENYIDATNALQKSGYATSPIYASSLQRVIETYGLNQFDLDKKVTSKSSNSQLSGLSTSYTGLRLNDNNELEYIEKNVFKNITGLIPHENKHYYVVDGKWESTYTGLVTNAAGTYYVKRGIIDRSFTGFVWHEDAHYYIVNGRWAPTYTGLGTNPAGTYYVKRGKIDRSFTGFVWHEDAHYYIVNGRWVPTYTGRVSNSNNLFGEKNDNTKNGIVDYEQNSYYFINGQVATSYSGYYLENMMAYEIKNGLVVKKVQTDISKVIFIDPGHGGTDSGAAYYGLKEKDLALDVSKKMQAALQQQGYTVILSREDDRHIDFRTERSRIVNGTNSDLFISIHFNASGRGEGSSAKGIETYWYQYYPAYQPKINQAMHNDSTRLKRSELLANAIHQAVLTESGATDRGVKRNTFAVLRETAKPATLIELGFMDNYAESQQIRQESYRQKLVDGLVKGIQKYYSDLIASYLK